MVDDERQIAWAAGLFEGEGSIFVAHIKRKDRTFEYTYLRMVVTSTDFDVLQHFLHVVECGAIHVKHKPEDKPHYKDAWYWQNNNSDDTQAVVEAFWPYLGERRRNKAVELGMHL